MTKDETTTGDLIRASQIAQKLGVSETSIFRMMKSGKFPAPHNIQHRGAMVWHIEQYNQWLQSNPEWCEPIDDTLISQSEACEILGVSAPTFYRMVDDGRIPSPDYARQVNANGELHGTPRKVWARDAVALVAWNKKAQNS